MVGSVLMDRMQAEGDFAHFEPVFFSTSNVGGSGPHVGGKETGKLLDAKSVEALKKVEIVVTCQGGDYTNEVYPQLRAADSRALRESYGSVARPENFLIDPEGEIAAIQRGPVDTDTLRTRFAPLIDGSSS